MRNNKKKKISPLPVVAVAVAIVALVATFIGKERSIDNNSLANGSSSEYNSNTSQGGNGDDGSQGSVIPSNKENSSSNKEVEATLNENGDMVINTADITEEATFFQVNSKGIDLAVLAVKAEDGTIRTAFDTCQICNGSPYAYFEQQGDKFQCQNCGNVYSRDMLEKERGGCNPVPIMTEEKTVTDTEIIIPAEVIEANAERFENWKKF